MIWLYVLYICRSCELLDQCGFENERRRKGARPGVQRPATGTQEFKDTLVLGQGCRHSGAALQSQVVRLGQEKQQEACVCAEQRRVNSTL